MLYLNNLKSMENKTLREMKVSGTKLIYKSYEIFYTHNGAMIRDLEGNYVKGYGSDITEEGKIIGLTGLQKAKNLIDTLK